MRYFEVYNAVIWNPTGDLLGVEGHEEGRDGGKTLFP